MSWESLLLPAAVVWPLLLSLASLAPGLRSRLRAALPLAPLPALAAAFWAPREVFVGAPGLLLDGGLMLTDAGAVFLGGAAALWFCAAIYAVRYMREDARPVSFALFWNLVLAGNLGVFIAADLASFYVFFALVSLMAYPLVIHDRKPASIRAGTVYIVLAVIGETALLVGFMLAAHGAGGAIAIEEVRAALAASPTPPAALWFLIAGFGIKAGLMPLHVWLPLAHPAAPTPASAVLSGAIVKAGVFGLLTFLPLGAAFEMTGSVLAGLGFTGLFAAALLGLAQTNAKTVLAYSTVSQMGLVVGVIGVAHAGGTPAAGVLALVGLYALHHGLAKGALFLGVGLAQYAHGAWRWFLLTALAATALSLAGAPLTAGAMVKAIIKAPAGELGATLIGLSSLTSGLILARYLFVLPAAAAPTRPPLLLLVPTVALAAAALSAPWMVLTWSAATRDYEPAALLAQAVGAWPLGLALVLAGLALLLRLKCPTLPEGDLLYLMRRGLLGASAALRQIRRLASAMAPPPAQQRQAKPGGPAWSRRIDSFERAAQGQAALAALLLLVAAALGAAFLSP